MTREELAKAIREDYERKGVWAWKSNTINMQLNFEMLGIIIEALEQEPCDDCVRRQEVLDVLKDKWGMFSDANDAMQESINAIKALKSVTPQPKMGHWIDKDGISDFMYCSNCGGKKHYSEKWIGCPYCLADMRESYKAESEEI